jgi:hypothetical protein
MTTGCESDETTHHAGSLPSAGRDGCETEWKENQREGSGNKEETDKVHLDYTGEDRTAQGAVVCQSPA